MIWWCKTHNNDLPVRDSPCPRWHHPVETPCDIVRLLPAEGGLLFMRKCEECGGTGIEGINTDDWTEVSCAENDGFGCDGSGWIISASTRCGECGHGESYPPHRGQTVWIDYEDDVGQIEPHTFEPSLAVVALPDWIAAEDG